MEKKEEIPNPDQKNGGKDRQPPWKLDVQGVKIESQKPIIIARDAIKQAGFDPEAGWIIVLKVSGEPKKEIELLTPIDLKHPGLEKVRLTPRQINNGEARSS